MNADVVAPSSLQWPLPPFFLPDNNAFPEDRGCLVEFDDGRTLSAELLTFEPERNSVCLQVPRQSGPEWLDLQKVRILRLNAPMTLVRHAAAIREVGTSESEVPEDRTFVVTFRDQQTLMGKTRGFVKEKAGLFLYLIGDNPKLTTNCFIPANHLGNVRIGPLLGEALAGSEMVTRKALVTALDKQAKLRQEPLDKQLTDRAIVSRDDLRRAMQRQRQLPNLTLSEILLAAGAVTHEQLDEALSIQAERRGRRIGDILVDMGAVTPRQLQMAMSSKLGIPYVNVREFKIDPTTVDLLGASFAIKHQVLPLLRTGGSLVIAVENPLAMDFAQDVRFITGLSLVPVIANPDDLRLRIAKEYSSYDRIYSGVGVDMASAILPDAGESAQADDLSQVNVEDLTMELAREDLLSATPSNDVDTEPRVTDNALVRLVNKIIIEAHAEGASDIHIEANPGKRTTRVRFRKDGELEDYLEVQPSYRNALISRIKIMARLDISEHRHSQDGKIDFSKFGPLPIELRVVALPTSNGLQDIVMRILGGVEPLPIDKLGMARRDLAEIKQMVTRSYGLILVCGPTGSGKTTTLHSLLHHINRPDIKIWTAEDPIEITQPGLRQVQINAGIDWTFAAAMRAFLRADPDVIMVGEMRDVETAKIGIEASLTGHLVFSTLHTNSAAESVVRLLELGMDPFNFADALVGILSQRLARKLCPKCKRPHAATEDEMAGLLDEYCEGTKLDPAAVLARWQTDFAREGKLLLHEAVGCDACKEGYRGRLGVYELLTGSPQIKLLTRTRGSVPQLVEAAQADGMRMLRQDAIEKVLGGLLDLGSARSASS